MVNGDNATIKRLLKYEDGIRLMPTNPAYEPLYFTNDEILEKPVKVIGKVIENRQKY
jgi:repressor LexA